MSVLTVLAKRLLTLTPYRVTRNAPNRFEAIASSLRHLRKLGYEPRRIIDGGAHLGTFAETARTIFPEAVIHMIEPQPACRAPLETLAAKRGFVFHPYAISDTAGTISMVCPRDPSTGAHVVWPIRRSAAPEQAEVEVTAVTLDDLFATTCQSLERTLLKLDLQGHEMLALRSASALLPMVEVVLLEVSFFQQIYEPTIPDLVRFFDEAGFDLFDIVSLSGRSRDDRLRQGDFVFVRRGSALSADSAWA